MNVRILLVDDHQMFRQGLRAVLENDKSLKIVGEASDGRQAVEMVGTVAPDVVIMDIGMPGLNGVDAARRIHDDHPQVKLIALSAHNDRRYISAMLEAGASGYILKEAACDEIVRAVQVVHRGGKCLSPEITDVVIEDYLTRRPDSALPMSTSPLAAREREVVQLLAEGKTSKEAASLLHISVKTVETHRRNIMNKLKIHSIAALTKFAIREGLTSFEK